MKVTITEYHLCSECQRFIPIPLDPDYNYWDNVCELKRPEINKSGGITNCNYFKQR